MKINDYNKQNKKNIPLMHCFDNNYVIPAAVAFYSMLENASPGFFYKLYVLHSDITKENQNKLQETISVFKNATLEFIDMNNKFDELFANTAVKGHYSKEMYYKFLAPSLFPQYDRIIVTDVDVVYQGDISKEFVVFEQDKDNYLAGVTTPKLKGSWLEYFFEKTYCDFSKKEREKLLTGAGYWIFNLEKMREYNCEKKFIDFTIKNSNRLKQPEQDAVNSICYPQIKLLPLKSLVCTYLYDIYKESEDLKNDLVYLEADLKDAFTSPTQLHYATNIKPWNTPDCGKADIWYSYLLKTPFFYEQMHILVENLHKKLPNRKYYLFGSFPILKIINNKLKLFGFITINKYKNMSRR